ncbi:MAG TPA: aminotransferase class V-fold PLP-dependent enzyme, partial [bacterium]|nr:aminotransferase class V-fold PLP-dependent enzyme [bacterium]
SKYNANIYRGMYDLSNKSTLLWQHAKLALRSFFNISEDYEVIFCKSCTEALNIAQNIFEQKYQNANIYVDSSGHNSNILPWIKGNDPLKVKNRVTFLDTNASGILEMSEIIQKVSSNSRQILNKDEKYVSKEEIVQKIVTINHISNVTGHVQDIEKIREITKKEDAILVVDGAQAVAHIQIDIEKLDPDVYAFSAHKMYGPLGLGVLIIKREHLKDSEPMIRGGGSVNNVTTQNIIWKDEDEKYEAGTQNIVGAVGMISSLIWFTKTLNMFAEKISRNTVGSHDSYPKIEDYLREDFLKQLDVDDKSWCRIVESEKHLTKYLLDRLSSIDSLRVIGGMELDQRIGVVSFSIEGVHSHDIASILGERNIAIRAGTHCANILHQNMNISNSVRVSLGIYNSKEDIDRLIEGIIYAKELFR